MFANAMMLSSMILGFTPTHPPTHTHTRTSGVEPRSLSRTGIEEALGGALVRRARAGRALGIFFDPCPTGDLLGGALSAVRVQCNYLDV